MDRATGIVDIGWHRLVLGTVVATLVLFPSFNLHAAADAAKSASLEESSSVEETSLNQDPDVEETWDSYVESTEPSHTAQDVTQGVRVEDIVEPPSDYRFAAFGKPDPFVPPMALADSATPNSVEIPIVSPLQRAKLSELHVRGIWEGEPGVRKALIMVPDRKGPIGIVAKVGDPIGQSGGKIISIAPERLTVREFSLAPDGTRQFSDQLMDLGPKEEPSLDGGTLLFKPGVPPVVVRPGSETPTLPPRAEETKTPQAAAGASSPSLQPPTAGLPSGGASTPALPAVPANLLPGAGVSAPAAPTGPAAALVPTLPAPPVTPPTIGTPPIPAPPVAAPPGMPSFPAPAEVKM